MGAQPKHRDTLVINNNAGQNFHVPTNFGRGQNIGHWYVSYSDKQHWHCFREIAQDDPRQCELLLISADDNIP